MIVRPAGRADLDAVAERLWRLDVFGRTVDPRHPIAATAAEWRRDLESRWFSVHRNVPGGWVAVHRDRVIGVLTGEVGPRAKIEALWVDESHRRAGFARALVRAFLGTSRDLGVGECDVTTLVRDATAVAFWRSMGFDDQYVRLRRSELRHTEP